MANGSNQLPYTGAPVRGLLLLGFALLLVGGALLVSVESRRRMLRRAHTISIDDVKDGTDRMTSWFLGR
jgi:LPXTG-motif cell wall-anchored protein